MARSEKILIAGAGVAGLTCAIWLARFGFRPVVVEKDEAIRAGGFLVSLSHRAHGFAEELGLLPALRRAGAGIAASSYHTASGRGLMRLDFARLFRGVRIVQIMRDDLQAVLFAAARDLAEIRFATSVAAIADDGRGADVTFADGSQERFDLAIGADGLHSSVRAASFGPPERFYRRLGIFCASFQLPNIHGLRNKFETHLDTARYVVLHTRPAGDLSAIFVWASSRDWPPAPPDRQRFLTDAYRGMPGPVGATLAHCPEDGAFYMDPLIQVELPGWHRGRVCVVGDAAYGPTLLSGQGASAAFSGASRLARALVELDPEAAFARYQAEVAPAAALIQRQTRSIAGWYVARSPARAFLRNRLLAAMPAALFERLFRRKYSRI